MKIGIYPKIMLELTWQNDKQKFSSDAKQVPHCLRCGNPLHQELAANSRSRFVNVYICSSCGMDEALGHPLHQELACCYKRTYASMLTRFHHYSYSDLFF